MTVSALFGFAGPGAEVEGNVFHLASNRAALSIVCSTKNLGKENKLELQPWFHS